jgi:hypothetical protein
MTGSPSPPSRPDALDAFEARALALLDAAPGEGWNALLHDLDGAEEHHHLYRNAPPIDPSEARRSSTELRRLIDTLRGSAPSPPPPPRTRAGYTIEGSPADGAEVAPAFVIALGARHDLGATFPDLWAIDAALWDRLDRAEPRELARLWLESPGRRLVQDIEALAEAPRTERLGASDLSLDRIYAAAGVQDLPPDLDALVSWFTARPPHSDRWRELHAAIPGRSLHAWTPRSTTNEVPRALQILDQGSPLGLRGAALAWLLDRAANEPFYEVEGLRRDLRDDLPSRLATALPLWLGEDAASAVSRDVETLALQHAARITAADPRPDAALRAWGVARWLQQCLRRSPYFGGDDEVILARLKALLPSEPGSLSEVSDALDPARFRLDGSALDTAEVALLGGALAHYQKGSEEAGKTFLPTPLPLVRALSVIAARPVRPGEDEAEAALASGRNALGWPSPHVAAPLAARHVMTELNIAWMEASPEPVQLETLRRFDAEPQRYAWVARAIFREGSRLTPAARERATSTLRRLLDDPAAPLRGHWLGTMAAGLLSELSDDEVKRAVQSAQSAQNGEESWRAFILDAIAGAAEPERSTVWIYAVEQLLSLMQDTSTSKQDRLNAALFALRRASASRFAGREALLTRLAQAAAAPPFSEHLGLRRELKRLGLPLPSTAAGGGR